MKKLAFDQYTEKICSNCRLSCDKIVWGYGNYENRIVFVGEAPGAEEQKIGKPFVGRSGKLLTEMLTKSKIGRDLVYITNIVKCRPENNRIPTEEEKLICSFFLKRELYIIKPEIIITLGSTATKFFIKGSKIGNVVGHIKWDLDKNSYIYPLYHPSYVLRNGISKDEYLKLFIKLHKIFVEIFKRLQIRFNGLLSYWKCL